MNAVAADLAATLPLKVCGLTRAQDVKLCLELGARFTGFIFARKSPRYITPEAAAALSVMVDRPDQPEQSDWSGQKTAQTSYRVGVFSGQSVEEVLWIMQLARLDYAQLHGHEDEKFCRSIGAERVIKVLWPLEWGSMALLQDECNKFAGACAFFLLDAGRQGGGSGESLPWEALSAFKAPKPWILAGGLGPDNLEEALKKCSPWAVDCNSALEEAPGVKNIDKLKAVAEILRNGLKPQRKER